MWSLQDAKNRFSAVVDAALAGQPQEVTRRGKPAVVVLSAEAYHRMLAASVTQRERFADHLLRFPAGEGVDVDRAPVRLRDVEF